MSKKHFIWAAEHVANKCAEENIQIVDCETYWAYVNLFNEFALLFDIDKFLKHIEKVMAERIKELQK